MDKFILNEINNHINVSNTLHGLIKQIMQCSTICIDTLKNGGKILLFGNGGSAADAQHIAAELVGRYKLDRKGLPAIALTTDSSNLTSIGNDFGYEKIFTRQIEALSKDGDIVIGLSTSGKSKNVLNALEAATKLNCQTIGFCGNESSEMKNICNVTLSVNSSDTPRIQEMHILLGHIICHLIDQEFKP